MALHYTAFRAPSPIDKPARLCYLARLATGGFLSGQPIISSAMPHG